MKMTPQLRWILTITMFFVSGCLYYSQPLLSEIGTDLHVVAAKMGMVTSSGLMGFVLGLLFIVPLADILEKKKFMLVLLWVDTFLFVLASFSQSFYMFLVVCFLIGATSVIGQIIIPYVALLSPPQERGKNLGFILSGALIGVLLARTGSGFIGEHFGWRIVYLVGASILFLMSLVLNKVLPTDSNRQSIPYKDLIFSMKKLFIELPELRAVSFNGALMYASLTAFWATLTFVLKLNFNLGAQTAGLFGLVGAAGAVSASYAGRIADRINPRNIVQVCIVIMIISYFILWSFQTSLVGLIIGTLFLDLGAQAATVSNQTQIYRLSDMAQSRLNTIYKIFYNLGGAVGASCAAIGWHYSNWKGVCLVGITLLLFAFALEQKNKFKF